MKRFFPGSRYQAVSRRHFLQSAAGISMAGLVSPALARGQSSSTPQSGTQAGAQGEKLSPAFIGGGGRVERDFYGDWLKKSNVPRVEGYSIYDASTQELKDWPEIGGRGLYLHFSGNVHMDAV